MAIRWAILGPLGGLKVAFSLGRCAQNGKMTMLTESVMTSSLQEAFLSHRGRTSGILGAILASLGASCGHLGHTWGHLGIHSAIWEVWLHALKLATLSALPVPMLKQVYVGVWAPQNSDFVRDIIKKRSHDDVNSMLI